MKNRTAGGPQHIRSFFKKSPNITFTVPAANQTATYIYLTSKLITSIISSVSSSKEGGTI